MSLYVAIDSTERPHANDISFKLFKSTTVSKTRFTLHCAYALLWNAVFPHKYQLYTLYLYTSLYFIIRNSNTAYAPTTQHRFVHQIVNTFQNIDSTAQLFNTNRLYLFGIIHGETLENIIRPSGHASCACVYVCAFTTPPIHNRMIHFLIPNCSLILFGDIFSFRC